MDKIVEDKFATYPEQAKMRLLALRDLIYEVAAELKIEAVEESLKWNEPSYLVKGGTAIRFDWKVKQPQQYFIFFNCKTQMINNLRALYPSELNYQGKRAIVFELDQPIARDIIKHAIEMAMTYKKT